MKDLSPRFKDDKTYVFGTLQNGSQPSDVPMRFSNVPAPPVTLAGSVLIENGIKTAQSWMLSNESKIFSTGKKNKCIYIYELENVDGGDPIYKLIHSSSRFNDPAATTTQATLNDAPVAANGMPQSINILPSQQSETGKESIKTISEMAKHNADTLGKQQIEFAKEREGWLQKIDSLNSKVIELNIEINSLRATNQVLEARLDEKSKMLDKFDKILEPIGNDIPEQQGLADRAMDFLATDKGQGALNGVLATISPLANVLAQVVQKKFNLNLGIEPQDTGVASAPQIPATQATEPQTEQYFNP
jgi:hypothetical protein